MIHGFQVGGASGVGPMGPMPALEPVQPAVVPVACRPNSSLRPLESKWAKKSMVVVYRDYIYIYSFSLSRNLTIIIN